MSGAEPVGDAAAGKRGAPRVAAEDDGAGLADGFDARAAGASLGPRVVAGLVDRLRASLGRDVEGGGTRFRLDLPPADPAG